MREGFTTGICAAAASKAAAIFMKYSEVPKRVSVFNLEGREFNLEVFRAGRKLAERVKNGFGVIKDSGDDKNNDVTHGITVISELELTGKKGEIFFKAGEGVGIVTLPGLKIEVGEAAINPVPREIIKNSVREIFPDEEIFITISVPDGEKIALKTFNPRLGIVGGISILGTSGVVKPWNEEAYLESLKLELNMINALSYEELFITFGNQSEKSLRKTLNLQTKNVIQCGNYIGFVLDEASKKNFSKIIITLTIENPGKLLKVAAGNFNTHNKISDSRLEVLCTHLALLKADYEVIKKVYESNTTHEAVEIIKKSLSHEKYFEFWESISESICKKCSQRINIEIGVLLIDNDKKIFEYNNSRYRNRF